MNEYRVIIMPTAKAELAEIFTYISADSPSGAARWYAGCMKAIDSLSHFPMRTRLAPEAEKFEREVRQLIYHSHRILYEVVDDTVNVLHVRHGARLPIGDERSDG